MELFEIAVNRFRRPLQWGFFVSTGLILLLLLARFLLLSSVKGSWPSIAQNRQRQIQQTIDSSFSEQVRGLTRIAGEVCSDGNLLERLSKRALENSTEAFESIDRHRPSQDISIDILDPVGNLVLWAGNHAGMPMQELPEPRDTAVSLSQTRLQTFLSVAIPIPGKFFVVVVYRVIEVNSPLSNRFVTQTSFTQQLSAQLGTGVDFSPQTASASRDSSSYVVPLKDSQGRIVGDLSVALPTVERELSLVRSQVDLLLSFAGGVAVFLAAVLLLLMMRGRIGGFQQWLFVSCILWISRVAWLFLGFPQNVLRGSLFDPAVYASPFGFGITSSAGETLITVLVLFASCYSLLHATVRLWDQQRSVPSPKNRPWVFLVLPAFSALLLWLTHAYGEAIRSLVFDSTVQFNDPTVVLPTVAIGVLQLDMLLLTISYFCLVVVLLMLMALSYEAAFREKAGIRTKLTALSGAFVLVWLLLNILPLSPKFPTWYPFLPFILGLLVVWFLLSRSQPHQGTWAVLQPQLVWLLAIGFLLSLPMVDSKFHLRDRERAQVLADELLRPVDSWLSVVVNDGVRVSSNNLALFEAAQTSSQRLHSDAAFTVWSQTLLGREGYNSAIVMFDASGQEISRFVVGMTSFEQTEMLKAMFNGEEEVLQLVERKVPGGTVKYYGTWSTIRDSRDTPAGFVAIMLAANQQTLFRGEIPEPLRTIAGERFERNFRTLSISEFRNGAIASTNNPRWYKGMSLDSSILRYFDDPASRYLWRIESAGGQDYELLYAQDDNQPDLILALSLEVFDVRWHLFNLVKASFVYLLLAAAWMATRYALERQNRKRQGLSFRARLVVAFAVLTTLPVFFIGYYNRELATERLDSTINKELAKDLGLLERRMLQTFNDEQDFQNGMTDDFCETVASEFGVDFSVFRSSFLKASSRPELYHAAILNARLPGKAYANTVLVGRNYFQDVEQVGDVQYSVGYKPLLIDDRIVGVIAVPALYRQADIDEELARRNASTIGIYAMVLVVVALGSLVVANRLSRPLHELSAAAKQVGRGKLDVSVEVRSSDEIGELAASFNEMVEELKQSRIQIARAERDLAWKEMAKQVAHEIKNPLTPMKLSMQHLRTAFRDKVRDLDTVVDRVTQTVIEQIEALARIATEFSNFARMPERKFERIDIHQLIRETVSLFQEIRGIEFRLIFSDTPLILVADGDELRRVFINLTRNSIQAMERGGTISISTDVQDHSCIITIADTGPGIPRNIQHKVFEPNFSTKSDGTGLGLAICRKIVEDLNGTIGLQSEEGKGTTFTIQIPLQAVS
jgi:signal transduction histidine kinase